MEKLKFSTLPDESGKIETIDISGLLTIETALQLKNELIAAESRLCKKVIVNIWEPEEIDLSAVQLFVAFLRALDKKKVDYQLNLVLDEEQKLLLNNVGIEPEFFMNN